MFHNYYFLKRYATALDTQIKNLKLKECFSQNKNELLLGFASSSTSYWLRANLEPQIGLLQTTHEFRRARKNSVDLFNELLDLKVTQVDCFAYERSFAIHFEKDYLLIFKMHASRSNILLAHRNKIVDIFRNQLPQDQEIAPDKLHQNPSITLEHFKEVNGQPTPFIPALGKEVKNYLNQHGYETLNLASKWELMQTTLHVLETNQITLYLENALPKLTLLPPPVEPLLVTADPIEAANKLYTTFTHDYYLEGEKRILAKRIETQIKKTENYVAKSEQKLEALKTRRGYEEIANIIMANLHQLSTGKEKVNLFDFYEERDIEIKLNPKLTPQKNAENFYRKSKNEAIELRKIEENISERKRHLEALRMNLDEVQATEDFRALRDKFPQKNQKKEEVILPYHQFSFQGYEILIGKHAKANDQLTLKVAKKSDYWLHARDVAGSHVVIRNQAGKNLPKNVLERAAELAAWFSKRKTDSLCPVMYTQKKFVRKAKGSPPGQVIVEKEEVIMVEPKGF